MWAVEQRLRDWEHTRGAGSKLRSGVGNERLSAWERGSSSAGYDSYGVLRNVMNQERPSGSFGLPGSAWLCRGHLRCGRQKYRPAYRNGRSMRRGDNFRSLGSLRYGGRRHLPRNASTRAGLVLIAEEQFGRTVRRIRALRGRCLTKMEGATVRRGARAPDPPLGATCLPGRHRTPEACLRKSRRRQQPSDPSSVW